MILQKRLAVFILALFIGACASSGVEKIKDPSERFKLEGFSLLPPAEEDWLILSRKSEPGPFFSSYALLLGKQVSDDENYGIQAGPLLIPKVNNDREFLRFVERRIPAGRFAGVRYQALESRHKLIRHQGANCVRYVNKYKDLKVQKGSDNPNPMLLETLGFVCPNPKKANTGVHLIYSYRHHAGNEDPKLSEKALAVFNTIEYMDF